MKKNLIKAVLLLTFVMMQKPISYGQLAVTAPILEGMEINRQITETGRFLQSIQNAISTTASLLNIVETGSKVKNALETANHYLEKVSGYVNLAQDVYDLAVLTKNIGERAILSQKILKENRDLFTLSDISDALDYYTYLLDNTTMLIDRTVKVYKAADYEIQKAREIKEIKEQISCIGKAADWRIYEMFYAINKDTRQKAIEAWAFPAQTPVTNYALRKLDYDPTEGMFEQFGAAFRTPLSSTSSIGKFVQRGGLYGGGQGGGGGSSSSDVDANGVDANGWTEAEKSQAKKDYEKMEKETRVVSGTFFYAVSALMLLFGAFKVYSRVMQGEDLFKAASVWILSAILAAILGVIIQFWQVLPQYLS